MLRLDVGTLAFTTAVTSLVSAFVIVAYSCRQGWWRGFSLSAALYGAGVLVIIFRDPLPAALAVIGGNLLVMLAAAALHAGLCELFGRPRPGWLYLGLTLAYLLGESYYFYGVPSINARIAVISLVRVPLFLHAFLFLLARRPAGGERVLEVVVGLWVPLLLLRAVGALWIDGPIDEFVRQAGTQALYFAAAGFGYVAIAIALLRMEGERMEAALARQVESQAQALDEQARQHADARQEIKAQLAFQDVLFDTIPSPVFTKSVDGTFLTCNRAFEQAIGLSRAELAGKTVVDFALSDALSLYHEADRRVLAGDGPDTYQAPVRFAGGAIHQVLFCKACFRDAAGAVAGIVGVMTDVTNQLRIEETLRRSESDLRAILENMTDIFYRADSDGRLIMVSKSAMAVLGYTADQMLGRQSGEFFSDPDARGKVIDAMALQGGSVTDFEFQMRHRDGRPVWVAISSRLIMDGDTYAGSEGIVRLIEERKRAEGTLQESQAMIQAMLDASLDAIMLFRADGTLLAVNEVMARRLGRTAGQMTGASLWEAFPPDVAVARRKAVAKVIETGAAEHYFDRRGDRDLDNAIFPVTGPDGTVDKVAVFSRDVTEQKAAEERIKAYIDEVERSNAELEQFAYVASHDLREPLRTISSFLSLLERRHGEHLDRDGRDYLNFARDGAKRMDRLVLDLLELSRIDRRGSPILPMAAGLALRQALLNLSTAMTEGGAEVEIDAVEPEPMVLGDGDQIIRLVQNLVGNAIKYRSPDRPLRIRLGMRRLDGHWEFSVSDNGIGIDSQYFERIFGIFQRLHTREKYDGTGIGLAICKKIVERHGGSIRVESEPDQGSTFLFTLPAAPP